MAFETVSWRVCVRVDVQAYTHSENVCVPRKFIFLLQCILVFPCVPLPQMPECAYPICVLAFRSTPACSFHTITNLTYIAVCLLTSGMPFPGAGLPPSLPDQQDMAEPFPTRCAVLVLSTPSSVCLLPWGQNVHAKARPALHMSQICFARQGINYF